MTDIGAVLLAADLLAALTGRAWAIVAEGEGYGLVPAREAAEPLEVVMPV